MSTEARVRGTQCKAKPRDQADGLWPGAAAGVTAVALATGL